MGAVHEEQRNEGRGTQEWYKLSLSDTNVIAQLIKNRSKLDSCYIMKTLAVVNAFISNGTPVFAEPIAVMYLDLDSLIEKCGFTELQQYILEKLMIGYSETDIAYLLETTSSTIRKRFERIVSDIKAQNDLDWLECLEIAGRVKIDSNDRFKACSKCSKFKKVCDDNFAKDNRNLDGFRANCKQCR